MRKIIITGGHLTPAVAFIEKLKEKNDWQVFFIGRKYAMEGGKFPSAESQFIPSINIPFFAITTGRLQRRFTRFTIPSLLKIPLGILESFFILLKIKPQVIVSFGGYISVPVVVAGWFLGIPALTHEQTLIFGLASKINSLFAKKIAVSFPSSLKYFPGQKVVLTGNPIRKDVFKVGTVNPSLSSIFKTKKMPVVYVTGGNQGAHLLNQAIWEDLEKLLNKYLIIHQTGERDFEKARQKQDKLPFHLKRHYFVSKYIGSEEIGGVFHNASLVVCRAGANTVCELLALGKPAILVPIPWAYKNEQMENAKLLTDLGLGEILPQKVLSGPILQETIDKVYDNLENYKKVAPAAKNLIFPDAAQKILEEVEKIAKV